VGFFTRLRDSAAYEILAKTSTDFDIIDMEHGSFDRPLLAECLLAGRAHGLAMLVRVPDDNESTIQHAIGAGRVNMWPHRLWRAGGVCLVRHNRETGIVDAGADPRRAAAYAMGW
jgi:hypothetical protein